MGEAADGSAGFDFERHGQEALAAYALVRPRYEEFARKIELVLKEILPKAGIKVLSVTSRVKDEKSFLEKAKRPSAADANLPNYDRPLEQITDLSGVRVIAYFLETAKSACQVVEREFEIDEKIDKAKQLVEEGRLGYQSTHFIVRLKDPRLGLPEYAEFSGLKCEIQVRTVLQHAWAEIEHDIQYKTEVDIPVDIRRKFLNLAGLVEIADGEFQNISNEFERAKESIRKELAAGKTETVALSGESLKYLLDRALGADARVSDFSYSYAARLATRLGVNTVRDAEELIGNFSTDQIVGAYKGATAGGRPGPASIFELMLLANFGNDFIRAHPWVQSQPRYWEPYYRKILEQMPSGNGRVAPPLPDVTQ